MLAEACAELLKLFRQKILESLGWFEKEFHIPDYNHDIIPRHLQQARVYVGLGKGSVVFMCYTGPIHIMDTSI